MIVYDLMLILLIYWQTFIALPLHARRGCIHTISSKNSHLLLVSEDLHLPNTQTQIQTLSILYF